MANESTPKGVVPKGLSPELAGVPWEGKDLPSSLLYVEALADKIRDLLERHEGDAKKLLAEFMADPEGEPVEALSLPKREWARKLAWESLQIREGLERPHGDWDLRPMTQDEAERAGKVDLAGWLELVKENRQ